MEPALRTVLIHRARDPAEARIIQMALEEQGVPVVIEGEVLQGLIPEVPTWDAAPRIMVEQSQVEAAREIIRRLQPQRGERSDEGNTACLACGHAMSDSDMSCPSCGWSFQDPLEK